MLRGKWMQRKPDIVLVRCDKVLHGQSAPERVGWQELVCTWSTWSTWSAWHMGAWRAREYITQGCVAQGWQELEVKLECTWSTWSYAWSCTESWTYTWRIYLTYCLNLKCLDLVWLSICLPEPDIAVGRAHEPGPCPDREGGELEVHRQPRALRPEPGEGGDDWGHGQWVYRGKNTESSAESREQKAESREQWEVPAGGEKTHLAGDGGALTCTWPSTIGTGTTTVKRGGPSSGRWRLAGDGLLARGRDDK